MENNQLDQEVMNREILSNNNATVGIKPDVEENKLSLNFCSFSVFCNFVINR